MNILFIRIRGMPKRSMAQQPAEPLDAEEPPADETGRGITSKVLQALTAVIMAAIIAFFGAWATLELGIAGPVAGVLFLVSVVWLYRKPIPSAAIGGGLYVTALIMFITPIVFYMPTVMGGPGESVEGFGTFAGSVIGLFFWWFIFAVGAIVIAALGYFAKKRARKKLGGVDEAPAEAV